MGNYSIVKFNTLINIKLYNNNNCSGGERDYADISLSSLSLLLCPSSQDGVLGDSHVFDLSRLLLNSHSGQGMRHLHL